MKLSKTGCLMLSACIKPPLPQLSKPLNNFQS